MLRLAVHWIYAVKTFVFFDILFEIGCVVRLQIYYGNLTWKNLLKH